MDCELRCSAIALHASGIAHQLFKKMIALAWIVQLVLSTAHASADADGQFSFTEQWRWVHFTTDEGLPSNRVLDVCEARDGTPWVSTTAGLAWYDGYIWHSVGLESGIPRAACRRITADLDSGILAVMQGHLYRVNRDGFHKVNLPWVGTKQNLLAASPSIHGALLLLSRSVHSGDSIYQRLASGVLTELGGHLKDDLVAPQAEWGTLESETWRRMAWWLYR